PVRILVLVRRAWRGAAAFFLAPRGRRGGRPGGWGRGGGDWGWAGGSARGAGRGRSAAAPGALPRGGGGVENGGPRGRGRAWRGRRGWSWGGAPLPSRCLACSRSSGWGGGEEQHAGRTSTSRHSPITDHSLSTGAGADRAGRAGPRRRLGSVPIRSCRASPHE